ncbi:histone chaperone [Sorochytrium milnesiophthora]
MADQSALLSMLNAGLIGRPSDYVPSLGKDVKRRLNALKNYQLEHSKIEREFHKEVMELEKKYHALYAPLYEKRAAVISGDVEPTDEECTVPETVEDFTKMESEEGDEAETKEAEEAVKGVPGFWLTALSNHPHIAQMITQEDEKVLSHLKDIRASYLEGNPGFRLEFVFTPNEYFSNETLTKTYYLSEPEDIEANDYVYDKAEGTTINWKEGKDLSVRIETKKQRHKSTNKTRVVKMTLPAETFFTFFSPPKAPSDDEEITEEDAQELDERFELDYQIGEDIKEKIVQDALGWFTGDAVDYDDDDEFDDMDDEDMDDEDDDEEDDE